MSLIWYFDGVLSINGLWCIKLSNSSCDKYNFCTLHQDYITIMFQSRPMFVVNIFSVYELAVLIGKGLI